MTARGQGEALHLCAKTAMGTKHNELFGIAHVINFERITEVTITNPSRLENIILLQSVHIFFQVKSYVHETRS